MTKTLKRIAEASLILVAADGPQSIARLLDRLRRQTAASKLEIVIAALAGDVAKFAALAEPAFAELRVIAADLSTSARARAAAIFQARAPIVIFVEDHCFPVGDDWAERIIRAHRFGHVAVGPVIRNANPGSATSWANLAVEYGPYMHRKDAAEMDFLPGHNSSYKREVLVQFGDDLADLLEAEWVLQTKLKAQGGTFWLDPLIEVEHLNYARMTRSIGLQFLIGWMFAASRSASWSLRKRLLYAMLFPAIAVWRMVNVTGQILNAPDSRSNALRSLPIVAVLLLASGIGEGIGYAFGDLGRRNALAKMEYKRWRNLLPGEIGLTR